MNILIAVNGVVPVVKYGGTQRLVWWLGKELHKLGHKVWFLAKQGSHSDFAQVLLYDSDQDLAAQIPQEIDIAHLFFPIKGALPVPYLCTVGGNSSKPQTFAINTVFVSRNHAERHNAMAFVHNCIDLEDYSKPDLKQKKDYVHFLAKASWRVKNLGGCVQLARKAGTTLKVLGGKRFDLKYGLGPILASHVQYAGMVGGEEKNALLRASKGLLFPVRWHEPFGIALIESLYYGCPVVGTPYGSLPELIPSEVGFLSDQQSELVEALKNIDQYDAQYCHEYVRDQFNTQIMTQRYLEFYEKILNGETLNAKAPEYTQYDAKRLLPLYGQR